MTTMRTRKIKGSCAIISLVLSLLCATASGVMAQDEPNSFSQEFPERTSTFATINPYTKASGSMTIVFSGVFHAKRGEGATGLEISRITGGQQGTFSFVPDDPSQPTITGKFRFTLAGTPQPHTETINFGFRMDGLATDGTRVSLIQLERAVVSEGSLEISFGSTQQVDN
jgi:hypothetical protein